MTTEFEIHMETKAEIKRLLVSKIKPMIDQRQKIKEVAAALSEQERVVLRTKEQLNALEFAESKLQDTVLDLIYLSGTPPRSLQTVTSFENFIGGLGLNQDQRNIYHGVISQLLSRIEENSRKEE